MLRPLGLLVQHEGHEGLDTAVYRVDTVDTVNTSVGCFVNTCLQIEERARLIIMKKKRKDHS